MDSIPREFLLLLLFAAVLVANALLRRRKPQAEGEPEPEVPLAEEAAEQWHEIGTPLQPAPRARAPATASPAPARRPRRFDRRNLLGSTRQVQDAIVVATILGRCRADEPHEPR